MAGKIPINCGCNPGKSFLFKKPGSKGFPGCRVFSRGIYLILIPYPKKSRYCIFEM
jgi:hypothetical protein